MPQKTQVSDLPKPVPDQPQPQQSAPAGAKTPQQQPSAQQPAPAAADAAKGSSSAPASRASPVPVAAQASMGASTAQAGSHSLLRAPSSPITPGMGHSAAGPQGHREKGVKARRAAAGSEVGFSGEGCKFWCRWGLLTACGLPACPVVFMLGCKCRQSVQAPQLSSLLPCIADWARLVDLCGQCDVLCCNAHSDGMPPMQLWRHPRHALAVISAKATHKPTSDPKQPTVGERVVLILHTAPAVVCMPSICMTGCQGPNP
jgi:hypothetical protein